MNPKVPKLAEAMNVTHEARIKVTENLPHKMYLRQEIANGTADDGTPIEVSTTGPHIIIALGPFPTGRQFVVSISDMTAAILEQLTQPVTA